MSTEHDRQIDGAYHDDDDIYVDETGALHRCLWCQRYISQDRQTKLGFHCDGCGTEPFHSDVQWNGFEWDGQRNVWVRESDA